VTAPHAHGGPECKALFAKLSEYLDGEIDAVDCAHVDAHLADCPPCRDFLESLRRTVRLVQSDPDGALPEEARRAVLESWQRVRRTRSGD
jgi:predicted anti-sigma-YlaC factor YlaD